MKFRLVETIEEQYPYYRGVGAGCKFEDSRVGSNNLVFITDNREYAKLYADGDLFGCVLKPVKLASIGNIEGAQGLDNDLNPTEFLKNILDIIGIECDDFIYKLQSNSKDMKYIKEYNGAIFSLTCSETFNEFLELSKFDGIKCSECEDNTISIGIVRNKFNDYIEYEVIKDENK